MQSVLIDKPPPHSILFLSRPISHITSNGFSSYLIAWHLILSCIKYIPFRPITAHPMALHRMSSHLIAFASHLSHIILSRPVPSHPVPCHTIPSIKPFHLIPSYSFSSYPIALPSHLISIFPPTRPIPFHSIPSHLNPSTIRVPIHSITSLYLPIPS